MQKLGCAFVVFGIGSFILPFMGFQFKIISIISNSEGTPVWTISLGLIIVGIIMTFIRGK